MTPPTPWTRESLLAFMAGEGASNTHGDTNGRLWRSPSGAYAGENRYRFDFSVCRGPDWRQYDTDQDAWYFGVWVNLAELLVVTFAEGDLSILVCDGPAAMVAELNVMAAFYGEAPPAATSLDADGTVTRWFTPRPSLKGGDDGE